MRSFGLFAIGGIGVPLLRGGMIYPGCALAVIEDYASALLSGVALAARARPDEFVRGEIQIDRALAARALRKGISLSCTRSRACKRETRARLFVESLIYGFY